MSSRGHSPRLERGESRIIPVEHVTRLLHEMDRDLDDFIKVDDVVHFVNAKKIHTFPEELLESMFAEANASQDGMMDVEQLAKAVGGQFPHRAHNEDWFRLFKLSLGNSQADRLTALPPSPPPPQQILTNFEREHELLTFAPQTNVLTHDRSRTAFSPAREKDLMRTMSTLSASSFAETRPDAFVSMEGAPVLTGRPATTDLNASVNRHLQPVDVEVEGGPMRCTFSAQAAYRDGNQLATDASHGFGWRKRLPVVVRPPPKTAEELHYGLHERDWYLTPSNAYIPLRVDGEATRTGSGLWSLRLLGTEDSRDHGPGMQVARRTRPLQLPGAHLPRPQPSRRALPAPMGPLTRARRSPLCSRSPRALLAARDAPLAAAVRRACTGWRTRGPTRRTRATTRRGGSRRSSPTSRWRPRGGTRESSRSPRPQRGTIWRCSCARCAPPA